VRFPIALRLLCLIIAVPVALSAIAGTAYAIKNNLTLLTGFEISTLFASMFCVLIGLGKFKDAPAIGMLIAAGAILTAAALGDPALGTFIRSRGNAQPTPGTLNLVPFALARVAAAAAFAMLATCTALAQKPATSLRFLFSGIALMTPLAGIVAAVAVGSIRSAILGLNGITLAAIVVTTMIVAIAFLAASGHMLIKAFEVGMPENRDSASA